MFIPKKEKYLFEKYAIHINTESFMDEQDKPVELDWLLQTRFPDLLKAKDKTSEEYKFIKKLKEESKDKNVNLLFVPENKRKREIVLEAINRDGNALRYVRDREIVLATVKQNGHALQFASKALQNDKDIVLAAVRQDGYVLEFASEEFKNNKDIVLAAVKKDGRALEYASEKLQNDKEILAVVK